MNNFYLQLWINWVVRVTLCSLFFTSLVSLSITFILYLNYNITNFNDEIFNALVDIFLFWFPIAWSFSILLALFRSLKYIFNHCYSGYKLSLLSCQKTTIEIVGYGNLVKVWRKWFILMIWLVASEMILSLLFTSFFTSFNSIFDWFNIYLLYIFILIAGYFSMIILSAKCKKVRLERC